MMRFRERRRAWPAGLLLVGVSIIHTPLIQAQPAPHYGEPVAVCEVADPRLNEASGLAASRRHPGYYYTHNDSGGQPHVYILDRKGRIHVTIRLVGAENVDWEDVALAPGESGKVWDVCVADIGDNRAERAEVVIYRFPEPDLSAEMGRTMDVKPRAVRCKYEDGARNAEGLAVHPQTGDAYVFSKRSDGACHVYRLAAPWTTTGLATLRRVGSARFPKGAPPLTRMVTAADIAPDGRRLVTRSHLGGWAWCLPERADIGKFTRVFRREPAPLKLAIEPQGEALCFSADGNALLTISEGTPTTLYEVRVVESRRPDEP